MSSRRKLFTGRTAQPDKDVSTEKSDLVENVESMYLSAKCSDVTFLVGKEKLPAHKTILGTRSEYFETLFNVNPEKKEITILNTSPEAFRFLLKYIYTDTITVSSDTDLMLQVLVLARQYSSRHLTSTVIREIKTILDEKNVCIFINGAIDHDLYELRDACHSFMDDNALEILSSESFSDLTHKSMVQILERETFLALRSEFFKSVTKWCEKNKNVDEVFSECVRLSLISVSDIISIVWPKLANSDKLIQTISKITGSEDLLPEIVLPVHENVTTVQYGSKVITDTDVNAGEFLTGNADVKKNVKHMIDGKTGIVIHMDRPQRINHIRMNLNDADDRYYSYYIETSLERNKWNRIVDYSRYSCRSVQNLYFDEQIAQYIKIIGTSNSRGINFHLEFFEARYKSKIPQTMNSVTRPETNVATPENKAKVIEGINPQYLLNEKNEGYTYHLIEANSRGIIVQLAQPYLISSMQFFLYDVDKTRYKYLIEISMNGEDWEVVVDRRDEICESWQDLHFAERVVVFIKITGTYSSHFSGPYFDCAQFKCPSERIK